MQKIRFFYIITLLLFIHSALFAGDSLMVSRTVRKVKIGPKELELKDILDSVVLRKLQFDEYIKGRNIEAQTLKNYQDLIALRSMMWNSASDGKSSSWADSLEQALNAIGPEPTYQTIDKLNTLGSYYGRIGESGRAINLFTQELKIAENLNNQFQIAELTKKLGVLYNISNNPKEAIKALEYNIKTNLSLNCPAELAASYLALADSKTFEYKFEEAEYCILKKALPLFRKTSNSFGRMNCFQTLGKLYILQGRLSEAKWFYIQANLMAGKLSDKDAKISSLISLAEVKKALGEHKSAISDFKSAELLAQQNKDLAHLVRIKGTLGEIYHEAGDLSAAARAIEEHNQLKNDLFSVPQL